jgi:hypothetical protein
MAISRPLGEAQRNCSALCLFFGVLYNMPILLVQRFLFRLQAKRDELKKNPQTFILGAANAHPLRLYEL